MLRDYAVGMIGLALLGFAWVWVQNAWRRSLHETGYDPDVLAGRIGCHGCGDAPDCERHRAQPTESRWEETA